MLLLGTAGLYLFRLGWVGLYDLDESVYAEISREMLALGNWITPHLDFIPYLEKPPLLYWLNALAFKAFGLSAFTARLATAVAAIAGVGFTYGIGRDIWNRRTGIAAGAMLATSFGYFVFGRMAMPDMLFASLVTAGFWGFGRALFEETPSRAAAFGGYAGMAGAVLAKGLIGLFPAVVVGAFVALTWDWRLVRRLKLVPGILLFLLIAAPWHILIERRYPGFLWFYFVNEHVLRALGKQRLINYATLPIGTYLGITLVWFCPWTLFLPMAVRRCWPRVRSGDRAERASLFVLLWAVIVIGFFVVSAARLEYYALPALPALALLVGRLWDGEMEPERIGRRSAGLTATWIALIAFAAALIPAAFLFPKLQHETFYNLFPKAAPRVEPVPTRALATARIYEVPGFGPLVPLLEFVVALILAGAAASAWAWFRRRPRLALACLVGAMALGLTAVERGFKLFQPQESVADLARVVRSEYRPGDQILVEGKYELHSGLGFYTRRRVRVYEGRAGILLFGSHYADPKGTFVSREQFARIWRGSARAYLLSDNPDRFSRLKALDPGTIVLGRTGPVWLFANRRR
ncbi:MAG: phospholipid carrier-dependent glycosyltransferase [Opitutaceae bacterium]